MAASQAHLPRTDYLYDGYIHHSK